MWVSDKVKDLFEISKNTVEALRTDLASVTAERNALRERIIAQQSNFDWMRIRLNSLELERVGLLEKIYNIKLPAPELVKINPKGNNAYPSPTEIENLSFDDIGEDMAKKLGFPLYNEA